MKRVEYAEIDGTTQVKDGVWRLEPPLVDDVVIVYSDMHGTNIKPIRQYMQVGAYSLRSVWANCALSVHNFAGA
jgi:hypothetical protein